jgi:NAD(P)-dependent dehydrogenase (short-subunit alcohol dehydrogenase family)
VTLVNQVAIVTGGGRGIGKAIAITFAKNGADVVIAARTKSEIEQVGDEIRNFGREALAIPTDIANKNDIKNMVSQTIKRFGKIDVLVNNAGVFWPESAIDMTEEHWDRLLAVNLKAVFLCSQEVARHMIKQKKGRIINISSVDGIYCLPNQAHYAASKAGVNQLTRSLAVDFAPYGIVVNGIAPSWVLTEMTEEAWNKEKDYWLKRIPAGRIGQPEDIAYVALFLASEGSQFIVGQTIIVDGGITLLL